MTDNTSNGKPSEDFYVAKVVADDQLVINAGSNDGIKIGDTFTIIEKGEEVFDPITGESLGDYELKKGVGKVIHVTERLSIIRGKNKPKNLASIGKFFAGEEVEEVPSSFTNPEVGDIARKK